jgi:predicted transcriptional regulator
MQSPNRVDQASDLAVRKLALSRYGKTTNLTNNGGLIFMSKLLLSLDDYDLRCQLSALKESVDYLGQQRIDVLLGLSAEKLRILLIVYFLNQAKTKTVSEEAHINRTSTTSYLNELYEIDKILDRVEEESETPGIKPTYVFSIVDDVVNNILANLVETIDAEQELRKNSTDSSELASHEAQDDSAIQRQIHQQILRLPRTGQKIFNSLDHSGKSVKRIAQEVGCDPTTVNKYFKRFHDSGIVQRESVPVDGSGRKEYSYFLVDAFALKLPDIHDQSLQPETGESVITSNSNPNNYQSNDEDVMNAESFQQQECVETAHNTDDKLGQAADKLDELIALIDQVKNVEEELRTIFGVKAEKLITRIKTRNF